MQKNDSDQLKQIKAEVKVVPNPLMSTIKTQITKEKVWEKTNLFREDMIKPVQVTIKPTELQKQTEKQEQKQNSEHQTKIQQKASLIIQKQNSTNNELQINSPKSDIHQIQEINVLQQQQDQIIVQKNNINISVVQSIEKGSILSKFMLYKIVGDDKHGKFQIYRKFTEFLSLRQILYERWPGCFIPSIRSKSQIKRPQQKDRHIRVMLTNFLIGLSYSDHLYYREQVQHFLRSPDIDITEMVSIMPVLKTKDVICRFQSCFGEQIQGNSDANNATFISNFATSLKKIITNLQSLQIKALTLSESYDNYVNKLFKFGQCALMYQKLSLLEYTNNQEEKTILTKDSYNKIQRLKQLCNENPFCKLYAFLNNQTNDAQAFLEVIDASAFFTTRRQEINQEIKNIQEEIIQISLGRRTIKTITTRKPTEQILAQLNEKLKKWTQEKYTIGEMISILEILISKKQISFFKKCKCDSYRLILKEWSALTNTQHPQLFAIWKFIRESSLQLIK